MTRSSTLYARSPVRGMAKLRPLSTFLALLTMRYLHVHSAHRQFELITRIPDALHLVVVTASSLYKSHGLVTLVHLSAWFFALVATAKKNHATISSLTTATSNSAGPPLITSCPSPESEAAPSAPPARAPPRPPPSTAAPWGSCQDTCPRSSPSPARRPPGTARPAAGP